MPQWESLIFDGRGIPILGSGIQGVFDVEEFLANPCFMQVTKYFQAHVTRYPYQSPVYGYGRKNKVSPFAKTVVRRVALPLAASVLRVVLRKDDYND